MAVTVPSTDVENYELYGKITQLTNAITKAGSNGPLVATLTAQKAHAQFHLVTSLLGSGAILASSVLANCTYSAPTQRGGDQDG